MPTFVQQEHPFIRKNDHVSSGGPVSALLFQIVNSGVTPRAWSGGLRLMICHHFRSVLTAGRCRNPHRGGGGNHSQNNMVAAATAVINRKIAPRSCNHDFSTCAGVNLTPMANKSVPCRSMINPVFILRYRNALYGGVRF